MPTPNKATNRTSARRPQQNQSLALPAGWSVLQRLARKIASDPARSIAVSLLITACASTSINALYLQTIKHPSPLFGAESTAPMPDPVPVPVARSTAFSSGLAGLDEGGLNAGSFNSAVTTDLASPTPKQDNIGDLIAGLNSKPLAQNKTVLLAQRALSKLGYNVKADGVPGGTTRQAIEKFERDNRLPVKGDLSPKILRELSMAAGFAVE